MTKKQELKTTYDARPQHLALQEGAKPAGMETLAAFIVPPRLKVVQRQSGSSFTDEFNPGDVIAVPQRTMVAPVGIDDRGRPTTSGTPFYVTPVLFFAEWCTWNPIETKGTMNAIRARSADPKSVIAMKARDPARRLEVLPDGLEVRHVEHLNYVVVLADDEHPLAGTGLILSFMRAEHKSGTNFAALLRMRKADIFGCVFAGMVGPRQNSLGEWLGVDMLNPAGDSGYSQWVADAARFEKLRELHGEMRDAHAAALIQPTYDEVEPDLSAVAAGTEY